MTSLHQHRPPVLKSTSCSNCLCALTGLQMGGGEAAVLTKESGAFRQG